MENSTPVFKLLIKLMGQSVHFDIKGVGQAVSQEIEFVFKGVDELELGILNYLDSIRFKGSSTTVNQAYDYVEDQIGIINKELKMLSSDAVKDYKSWLAHDDKHAPAKHTKFETGIDPFSILIRLRCIDMESADANS